MCLLTSQCFKKIYHVKVKHVHCITVRLQKLERNINGMNT